MVTNLDATQAIFKTEIPDEDPAPGMRSCSSTKLLRNSNFQAILLQIPMDLSSPNPTAINQHKLTEVPPRSCPLSAPPLAFPEQGGWSHIPTQEKNGGIAKIKERMANSPQNSVWSSPLPSGKYFETLHVCTCKVSEHLMPSSTNSAIAMDCAIGFTLFCDPTSCFSFEFQSYMIAEISNAAAFRLVGKDGLGEQLQLYLALSRIRSG
jgi:hypothetical protein